MNASVNSVPLGEIADVIRGVSYGADEAVGAPTAGYVPVLRAGNIQGELRLDEDLVWVPSERVSASQRIQAGDIVMCTSSGSADVVGKTARARADWDGSYGAFCAGIRVRPKIADAAFLHHFLGSPTFKAWTQRSAGANIKNIRKSELEEFKVPLPPLVEQKRIAAILEKADAIRRQRQQAIQLADKFLRSVFLDMFGDLRLNPKGWGRVPLGEITSIDAPMVDPTAEKYLDLVHIGPDRIEKDTGMILPALTARQEGLISGKFLFDKHHVLYTKIRPYLRKVALPSFQGLCSADMYPVSPDTKKMTREYLWAVLISKAFVAYFESLPDRASIPKMNRDEFAAYECMLPPLELQKAYSRHFRKLNDLVQKSRQQLTQADTCFDALAQRAFRGEL